MKIIYLVTSLLFFLSTVPLTAQEKNGEWTESKAKNWFKKKEYLKGLSATPDASIDKVQFAQQYHRSRAVWDKVFTYLKQTDLKALAVGRHVIDGENAFAIVQEAPTKDYDKTAFESHRKYIDLQFVISGVENMSKAPLTAVTVDKPYVENNDIAYYTGDGKIYTVPEGSFMLFFPTDAHRPNITPGGNKVVKKVVVKIRVAG